MSETDYFFVYGTLKVGGYYASDFDRLRVTAEIATIKGYDLFNLGSFPAIVEGDGEVHGELHEYAHPGVVTSIMDEIEGFNGDSESSLYARKRIKIDVDSRCGGKTVDAIVYVFAQEIPEGASKIEDGIWRLK